MQQNIFHKKTAMDMRFSIGSPCAHHRGEFAYTNLGHAAAIQKCVYTHIAKFIGDFFNQAHFFGFAWN
jgi:hypothetical protein